VKLIESDQREYPFDEAAAELNDAAWGEMMDRRDGIQGQRKLPAAQSQPFDQFLRGIPLWSIIR